MLKPRLLAVLLCTTLPMMACNAEQNGDPAAPQAATAPAQPADETAAAAAPGPGDTPVTEQSADAAGSGTADAAEAAPQVEAAPYDGPVPVEGTHYVRIAQPVELAPTPGKIEVVEMFGYTCPHCAALEPVLDNWKADLPADVEFRYLPAAFGGYWVPYARAFFAAETLGLVDATHNAMFQAIHVERALPVSPQAAPQIAEWYGQHGADAEAFASTMDSFAINAKLARSNQLAQQWGIEGTPSIVVDGKYRVMTTREGFERMLQTVDYLIDQERRAGE
ncbi:thiol:disulfide interchange protein DsbA/DsbL [Coralloluteibacterium stylophorae]|uniref:Thiol:disulfide interchange protein DsbA n=3 Tax=Coralloluteibacterium stylophorae TaxID=1776034 RepID=A0AAP2CDQ8_9GAMM|nr:thiol:disulfide interchange protein DsbA/DsbL [Coralloluteibacterium stylophorae]MBS7458035.1 thiol:disulfide interchange protein DsbA/DsbL [Coralloluteibacterium stylophorae]